MSKRDLVLRRLRGASRGVFRRPGSFLSFSTASVGGFARGCLAKRDARPEGFSLGAGVNRVRLC